ncbi:DUF3558 family protein [Nocardia sp. NPDC051052]|uniref:DUF3558 family protein n=1 Tax=Nocardia sp. NPDC051052 TaxID=3364322 RepID=UPI003788F975
MDVRRRRAMSVVLALLLVAGVTGRSRGSGGEYKAGFSELPARCSDALKPAQQAIKAFAGEAYSSAAESQDADREVGDASQNLTCAMKFGGSVLREPVKPYRTPMWRNVSISYFLSLYPIKATDTRRNLADYVAGSTLPSSPRPTFIGGIGEDAITWVKESKGDPPRVSVKFSINNLIVTVETWGKDWSGVPETFPVVDSPELRADLRTGTEAIAKAIAQQAPSALPTAILTQPSLTSGTSTPTTTKAPDALWDPCGIPADRLSAAGLDVKSQFRGEKESSSAMCMWRGGWYRLRVFDSLAPFEWSIYEDSTYVRPKPVTIGDRHAVQVRWDNSQDWCVLAFEMPREANLPDAGGQTLTFEASLTEDRSPTELCDELTRVTTAVAASLPPTS